MFAVLVLLALVCGAVAAVHQMAWLRATSIHLWGTSHGLAAVLCVSALGAAAGAAWASRRAARPDPCRRLGRLLGWLSVANLGAWAAVAWFGPWFGAFFYRMHLHAPGAAAWLGLAGGAVVLSAPVALAGALLPVLGAAAARGPAMGFRLGALGCAAAVGGGTAGVACVFDWFGTLGLRATWLGAAAVGLGLWLALRRGLLPAGNPPPGPFGPVPGPEDRSAFRAVCLGLTLAGAAAAVLEFAWMRAVRLSIGSCLRSSALVLGPLALAWALGGGALGWLADRRGRGWALVLVALGATAGGRLTVDALGDLPVRAARVVTWARSDLEVGWAFSVRLLGIVLLPGMCLGALWPLGARALVDAGCPGPRATTLALAVTGTGGAAGALVAGFVLVPGPGARAAILAGVLLTAAAAAAFLWSRIARRPAASVLAGSVLVAAAAWCWTAPRWDPAVVNSGSFLNARLYTGGNPAAADETIRTAMRDVRVLHEEEDAVGRVAVAEDRDGRRRLSVDGKPEGFSTGGFATWMGHLALSLRPDARSALVVGLGSGATLRSVAEHEALERLDCVEISRAVVDAARRWFADTHGGALEDPRVRLVLADARAHLEHGRGRYDVIVAQPSSARVGHAAYLYTEEAFAAMRRSLAPGGVACAWFPGFRAPVESLRTACATWAAAWPHAAVWGSISPADYVLVGSDRPLSVPYESLAREMARPAVRRSLAELGTTSAADLLGLRITDRDGMLRVAGDMPPATDDDLRLGFLAPMAVWRQYTLAAFNLFAEVRVDPGGLLTAADPTADGYQAVLRRLGLVYEVQRAVHRALRMDLVNHRDEALGVLAEAAARNPSDPLAAAALRLLSGR